MKFKEYTRDDVVEMVHCQDILYFTEKYTVGKKLTENQIKWLTSNDRRISLGDERASGRTIALLARAVHEAFYKPWCTVLFITHNQNTIWAANSDVRQMIEKADHVAPQVTCMNKTSIEFDNGAKIIFQVASPHCGRGRSVSTLMIDNTSLIKWQVYDEMMQSILPCIHTGGKLMESY